jgi:hypothetical protein
LGSYRRRGHYRRGRNGAKHWVSAHDVRRGARRSTFSLPSFRRRTRSPVAQKASRPASGRALIAPNARCPVCGAVTYFYANEYGSRVYFDSLGPPWPKHPCTDNPRAGQAGPARAVPMARVSPTSNRWARSPRVAPSPRPHIPGGARPTFSPSTPWTVAGRWTVEGRGVVHLHPVGQGYAVSAWQVSSTCSLRPGDTVFLTDGGVSYLEPVRFQVAESPIHYLGAVALNPAPIVRLFRWLTGRR